jgi:hypothetical protein
MGKRNRVARPPGGGRKASHAVRGPDGGVWLFDPLDAPGVDDLISDLGEMVGVAAFSNWHARDAGAFALRRDRGERHGRPLLTPNCLSNQPYFKGV